MSSLDDPVVGRAGGLRTLYVESRSRETVAESLAAIASTTCRQRRLELARDALLSRRVSIDDAAGLAGYKHRSNFATTFKRRFGAPPGSLRAP